MHLLKKKKNNNNNNNNRMQILANGAARTVGYAFLMSRASTLVIEPLFLVRHSGNLVSLAG
jgi:hypothetical protein